MAQQGSEAAPPGTTLFGTQVTVPLPDGDTVPVTLMVNDAVTL